MIRQMIKKIIELEEAIAAKDDTVDSTVYLLQELLYERIEELEEQLRICEEEISITDDLLELEFLKGERDLIKDFLSSLR